jgi:hypothetical protein
MVWVIRVLYIVSAFLEERISRRCLLVEKGGDWVIRGVRRDSESRCRGIRRTREWPTRWFDPGFLHIALNAARKAGMTSPS